MSAIITPHIHSGLGNHIFQLAAAYHFAKKCNKILLINKNIPVFRPHTTKDYNETLFKNFNIQSYEGQYTLVREEKEFNYNHLQLPPGNILLQGYFQDYRYIEPEFVDLLDFSAIEIPTIDDISNRYFVHVRRGDYINSADEICGKTYYKRALELLPPNSAIFIVSNDMNWCIKSGIFDNYDCKYAIDESGKALDELQTLKLMSMCLKGGICVNSTFSWWGLYLIKNPDKLAIWPEGFPNKCSVHAYNYIFPGLKYILVTRPYLEKK